MKKHLSIFFFLAVQACIAQFSDSLHKVFTSKKSLNFSIDSRNSFIDNNRVSVQSVKAGIEFGKKIAVGAGYAWLNTNTALYNKYGFYDSELKKDTAINKKLSLRYISFYVNYIYYESRRWEFSVPIQIGIGKLGYSYQYKGMNKNDNEGYCFLYEPEVNVKFKVFRWLGLEGDIGYRLFFKNNRFIKNTFNSPLLAVGVFVVWNEIAAMTFPRNKWVQRKFGPSQW